MIRPDPQCRRVPAGEPPRIRHGLGVAHRERAKLPGGGESASDDPDTNTPGIRSGLSGGVILTFATL